MTTFTKIFKKQSVITWLKHGLDNDIYCWKTVLCNFMHTILLSFWIAVNWFWSASLSPTQKNLEEITFLWLIPLAFHFLLHYYSFNLPISSIQFILGIKMPFRKAWYITDDKKCDYGRKNNDISAAGSDNLCQTEVSLVFLWKKTRHFLSSY